MPPKTAASPSRSEAGVQEGAPVARRAADLAIWPSIMSAEHEDRDDDDALPEPALREADQRPDHHTERAGDGHHVRRDAEPDQQPGERTEHDRGPGAAKAFEHQPPSVDEARSSQAARTTSQVWSEQLRQRLGLADDRQEVRVAGPARHHVLVQVGGDPGAGDRALVDARD